MFTLEGLTSVCIIGFNIKKILYLIKIVFSRFGIKSWDFLLIKAETLILKAQQQCTLYTAPHSSSKGMKPTKNTFTSSNSRNFPSNFLHILDIYSFCFRTLNVLHIKKLSNFCKNDDQSSPWVLELFLVDFFIFGSAVLPAVYSLAQTSNWTYKNQSRNLIWLPD